jgi:hypothetical protein
MQSFGIVFACVLGLVSFSIIPTNSSTLSAKDEGYHRKIFHKAFQGCAERIDTVDVDHYLKQLEECVFVKLGNKSCAPDSFKKIDDAVEETTTIIASKGMTTTPADDEIEIETEAYYTDEGNKIPVLRVRIPGLGDALIGPFQRGDEA